MPVLTNTISVDKADVINRVESDFNSTFPKTIWSSGNTQTTVIGNVRKKYYKNGALAIEVTAVIILMLTCGGYAVYALLSLPN